LLAFDLQHGDVGTTIETNDLCRVFTAIGGANRDFVRVSDHVRVGENVTVGADDEA
jgi:hypothetical protein